MLDCTEPSSSSASGSNSLNASFSSGASYIGPFTETFETESPVVVKKKRRYRRTKLELLNAKSREITVHTLTEREKRVILREFCENYPLSGENLVVSDGDRMAGNLAEDHAALSGHEDSAFELEFVRKHFAYHHHSKMGSCSTNGDTSQSSLNFNTPHTLEDGDDDDDEVYHLEEGEEAPRVLF